MKKIIVLCIFMFTGCSVKNISETDTCSGVTSYSVDIEGTAKNYKCHEVYGE